MKKPIGIYLSLLFLLAAFFLSSCDGDESSHVVMTQLAYEASANDTSITADQREALRQLYVKDTTDLNYYLKNKGDTAKTSYSPSHGSAEPAMASAFPINTTLAAVVASAKVIELCPCGTGMCACPGATATIYFTTRAQNVEVKDGDQPLTEEPLVGEVDAGWKSFKLTNMADRTFTLTITGDFAGIGTKTYKIPMRIKEGKLYTDR